MGETIVILMGLVELFAFCIDSFNLTKCGRPLNDYDPLLSTRLWCVQLRFAAWGYACGLAPDSDSDKALYWCGEMPEALAERLERRLMVLMTCISDLFVDLHDIKKRCHENQPRPDEDDVAADAADQDRWMVLDWRDRHSYIFKSSQREWLAEMCRPAARWTDSHRQRLVELIADFSNIVTELEALTEELGDVAEKQRHFVGLKVAEANHNHILEYMVMAGGGWLGRAAIVSDVARQRLLIRRRAGAT